MACAASLLASAPATAMTGAPSGLSPRLSELASGSLDSASNAAQAEAVGLVPDGPGGLLRQGRRVVIYVRFAQGAVAALPALRAAGGEVVDSSRRYQTVTVAAKPSELRQIAAVTHVVSVTEAHAPFTAAACPSGEVVSEGVQQLNAGESPGEARTEFAADGSGVTVGVLSDSFDAATEAADGSGPVATHALEDEEAGDLPGPESPCGNKEAVEVLDEFKSLGEEAADEGRAMAQIVHDVAPGAGIDFATAFKPAMLGFAENIGELAEAGADVIVDDVFYLEEPFFQDGPVAVAVNEAVAAGATYFSAAGNDNLIDAEGHDIASWETPGFRDTGSCPAEVGGLGGFNASHCLDFDPGAGVDRTFGIKVKPDDVLTVDLQWSEPWFGVKTDLDAFLLDTEGHLREIEAVNNLKTQEPTEILQWVNASSSTRTVQLVINRFAGKSPRLKLGLIENGSGVAATEYPRSTGEDVVGPTIFGHSGSASAVSVGAIPFDSTVAPEPYSSRGPVRHDFGPVEGVEPAESITPEMLSKPDVTATDCGLTTFFAFLVGGEGWRFCGTSAAAPHAAGVAALMLDEEPGADPAGVRTALQSSALKVGSFGPCAVGAGLIDATGAVEDLLSPPAFTPGQCLPPEAEVPVEEARAPGNWGVETPTSSTPPTTTQATGEPAPRTSIRHKPPHRVRTRSRTARVVFTFAADQVGATFACRIDTGLFRPCPRHMARRFGLGSHIVRVLAVNASGAEDPTPVAYRFRVVRLGG